MEENERTEGGITIGDIFRTIFSQKWLALIIAVVVTLVGILGIYFGLNSIRKNYSVTFILKLPNSADSPTSYSYPDGKRFHFSDMVSSENLEKVKNSSRDFENVDVTKMVQQGDISITRVIEETATGSNIFESNFTISVKANYFNSKDIARNFLITLTEVPKKYLTEMDIDYDTYLTSASEALTYDTQLNYLQSQANYLTSQYSSFISSYGGNFVVNNGKTLNAYKSEIDVFNSNNRITQLKNEALEQGYIKSELSLNEYKSQKFEYNRQLEVEKKVYQELVELLQENHSSTIFDNPQIIEQRRTINNLLQKIDDLDRYIEGKQINEQFATSVSEVETSLKKFTSDFSVVASAVYSNASSVSYSDSNIVAVSGEMGLIKAALLSLAVGIILAAIVAYIVGYVKKSKINSIKPVTVPVYQEAQLQIAATEDNKDTEENKDDK